jgi:AcrR family transcriptional regulator
MLTDKNVNNKARESRPVIQPRRRRSPAASRENILAAAEAILTASGPLDLKLTEVAGQAGVATATVLHHFGSIDGVQTALMERMVTRLAARVVAIAASAPGGVLAVEADIALFDAFEEQGAARLAAWLVMTGEAKRLSVVKRAVDEVLDLTCARLENPPPRALMEELALASITAALGAGLFGQTLSTLLGHDPGSARAATLAALAARAAQTGLLEG